MAKRIANEYSIYKLGIFDVFEFFNPCGSYMPLDLSSVYSVTSEKTPLTIYPVENKIKFCFKMLLKTSQQKYNE